MEKQGKKEMKEKGRREENIGKEIKRRQKEGRLKQKKLIEGRKEGKEEKKLTRKKQRNQFRK